MTRQDHSTAMRVPKSAPPAETRFTRSHEMIRLDHSCKAMRVPRKSAPAAEISALNADLFTDWFKAAKIRALNEDPFFMEPMDTRGECAVPTLHGNHGYKLEARWDRCPKKRVMKVCVLHGSSGDSPWDGPTLLSSASDDASCASTSLGTPSRAPSRDYFLRETKDARSPQGTQGSVLGWLRRSYCKFFMTNQPTASEESVEN